MATKPRSKPFERFGTYILFRKLDTHALGEVWRAGKIENGALGALVALHRFTSGDKDAMTKAAEAAKKIVPQITGGTIVRSQTVDVVDGIPHIAHEYSGGRTLRHIVDRARGGTATPPQPIPTEQALAITEKIASSVEAIGEMKIDGKRLVHGAILPQFVWVTEDGDVRALAHQMSNGVIASAAAAGREVLSYVAPEVRDSREATKASDVYSLGAILYLLTTGEEPPDGVSGNIPNALASAMLMHGEDPVPPEIRTIIQRSLNVNPAERYGSAAEFRQALTQLLNSGAYAPTTFNLAFYLHTLLRKEMEGEAIEREKESKVNLAPYIEELTAPAPVAEPASARPAAAPKQAAAPVAAPSFGSSIARTEEKSKSKGAIIGIAAAVVLAAIGGGYFMMNRHSEPAPAAKPVQAAAAPVTPAPQPVAPVVAATPAATSTSPATTTNLDEAARKKAIEDEVNRRLQEELAKLQSDYEKQLAKQNAVKTAAATQAPAPAPVERKEPVRTVPTEDSRPVTPVRTDPVPQVATQTTAPAPAVVQPPVQQPPAAPQVREGDLVASSELDQQPAIVKKVAPSYPPMALRQRAQASVLVTVLISETGQVLDVRVLRGATQRLGFDEAAVKAARSFVFRPGVKDGKRVKSWFPIPFNFAL